jgi:hypothetical protein
LGRRSGETEVLLAWPAESWAWWCLAVFAIDGWSSDGKPCMLGCALCYRTEDALPKEWRRVSVHAVGRQCWSRLAFLWDPRWRPCKPLSVHSS